MLSSAITTKGQVTIPAEIRKKLSLKSGDQIGFDIENDKIVIFRREKSIRSFFGVLKSNKGKTVTLADMDDAIHQGILNENS